MISVVIPLYNKEKQIANTLRSVFAQTYTDYEIIVVNDGSTDNSVAVVESLNDPLIRLIHQKNAGVSAARNRGIEEARGEYIALLDGDDEWKPKYLETIFNLIKKYHECDVFATNYEHVDIHGRKSPTVLKKIPFKGEEGILSNYFEVAAVSSPPICSICIAFRKEAIQSIGNFPVGIKSGEDLLTWAKLACRYEIAYSVKSLAIYHLGEGYDFSHQPPRTQDEGDPVGKELKRLLSISQDKKKLELYISHWHKMRASVALRYGEIRETFHESVIALKYNHKNYKVVPFMILAILPKHLRNKIISLRNYI